MKKINVLALILLVAPTLHAEECFMVTREITTKKPQVPSQVMQGLNPEMMSPEMRKMMKDLNTASKPELETQYWTVNSVITVNAMGTTIFDVNKLEFLNINPASKSYSRLSLKTMLSLLKGSSALNVPAKEKLPPLKVSSTEPKATGIKHIVAGIECQEYQVRTDVDGKAAYQAAVGSKLAAAASEVTSYNLETQCVSVDKPEAYFRLRKIHEGKVLKMIPEETLRNLGDLDSGRGDSSTNLLRGLLASHVKGVNSPFYSGFVLESQMTTKREMKSKDPRITAAMNDATSGAIKTVKAIATTCPNPQLLQVPPGYKELK